MNWTIRNKIIAIGVVSALALTCLQGIAFLKGRNLDLNRLLVAASREVKVREP